MSPSTNKRKFFFANKYHQEIFFLVFLAMIIPTIATAIGLFYLIFNITAEQSGIPETIAYTLIPAAQKVMTILLIVVPIVIAIVLLVAHRITHRIVGPLDRMTRELGECLEGKRKGHLKLRPGDKLWPLVHLINKLIDKI